MGAKRKLKKSQKALDGKSQNSDASTVPHRGGAKLRIYQENPGDVPLLDFLADLRDSARVEIIASIEALGRLGHRMRPPHNEHLGDQLYYLRINGEGGTYRVFYWPFGQGIVVLGHGFSKKTNRCPPQEIGKAMKQRERFAADPAGHTYAGEVDDK